jgi:hypothetical protein
MTGYTYDELYGVDLDSYCAAHETTIKHLIEKIDIDIQILNDRMKKLMAPYFMEQDNTLINTIHNLIKKKNEHKDRLNDWKINGEYR